MNQIITAAASAWAEHMEKQASEIRHALAISQFEKAAAAKPAPKMPTVTRGKRILSPEARQRIAAAQQKRWAEFRKGKVQ